MSDKQQNKIDLFLSVVAVGRNITPEGIEHLRDLTAKFSDTFKHVEFVFVDDASESGYGQLRDFALSLPNSRILQLSRPQGSEVCIMAGLDVAIGDYVMTLEVDRDPINVALEMAIAGVTKNIVLIGKSEEFKNYGFTYRLLRRTFFFLSNLVSVEVPQGLTTLAMFPRSVITLMQKSKEKHRYVRLINHSFGISYREFAYVQLITAKKRSIISAIDHGVTMAITQGAKLLRIGSILSIAAAFLPTLWMLINTSNLIAFQTVVAVSLTAHFLVLATMCEYLMALYTQTKGTELYYVLEDSTSAANPTLRNISDLEST